MHCSQWQGDFGAAHGGDEPANTILWGVRLASSIKIGLLLDTSCEWNTTVEVPDVIGQRSWLGR